MHLTQEFGWTRGDIGVAGMVAFVTGALALPVIGRLVDRFGYRSVVLVCVPALSLLYLMIALQPGPYRIHLVLMVWGGLFGGGTAALTYTRPVIAAFQQQRGMALGVATAGTSITAIIVPPVVAAVIAAYGWRAGLYAMAALTDADRSTARARADRPRRSSAGHCRASPRRRDRWPLRPDAQRRSS